MLFMTAPPWRTPLRRAQAMSKTLRRLQCSGLILCALLGLNMPAFAQDFSVEGFQAPAWFERDGQRQALRSQEILNSNDVVITGDKGKIWLKMPDGALVKLGNNAKMRVNEVAINETPEGNPNLSAGLDIIIGAFRYTTSQLQKHIGQGWQREVDIRLARTATIGIRGTDLWGQVASDNQFVVLLEGQIEVSPSNAAPLQLNQPLQIFKTVEEQAQPLATVEMSAVEALAPETELDFGQGVQKENGQHTLILASFSSSSKAQSLSDSLRHQGYSTITTQFDRKGESWYRVQVQNYSSREDAKAIGQRLKDGVNVISPWVKPLVYP